MGDSGTFDFMARIALNGRLLVPGKLEGIGRFTLETLKRLVALRPEDEFLLVVDRPFDELFLLGPNVEVVRILIPARRPWLMKWWFGNPLARCLKRWNADAFLSLEGPLASTMPPEFPQLSVIHDLNFEHRPKDLPVNWKNFYRRFFPEYATRAQILGTVSEYSRSDLSNTYGVDANEIRVFPNATDDAFVPMSAKARQLTRDKLTQGAPYFIYVGSFHARKNIDGLLNAFKKYVAAGGCWDLVMVGESMWASSMPELPESVRSRVHLTGRLENDELVEAIGSAGAMVFVPWFEGFGIPIIEAMACGVPVIASNVTSLPEVCGNAEFALVDASNSDDITGAMLDVERDPNKAQEASSRGMIRAKEFSWDKTAEAMSAAVDQLLIAK